MPRYQDLALAMAKRIAEGDPPPGAALPSMRRPAGRQDTNGTAARALRELTEAGVIVGERGAARVAPDGISAARWMLRGGRPFRLAGGDDPALALVLRAAGRDVVSVELRAGHPALAALWSGRADGAALHLRHSSGEYNAPFARAALAGREAVLVGLWRREQGILVAAGNPRAIATIGDLTRVRVARRAPGCETRTLGDRLLRAAGADPDAIAGPVVELHLDVAVAVATGQADAGLGVRAAAAGLGLGFVPLAWEPFAIATTRAELAGLQPLLHGLEDPALRARIRALGGYDLSGLGEITAL